MYYLPASICNIFYLPVGNKLEDIVLIYPSVGLRFYFGLIIILVIGKRKEERKKRIEGESLGL